MKLKKKVYHWTSLSEGLLYIEWKPPKKVSFWINNKREAESYAIINKANDKSLHWSIVQGELTIEKDNIMDITPQQYKKIQKNSASLLLTNKIGRYTVGNFEIYILPKNQSTNNNTIIKVV